jgi:hypothetical protein
MTSPISSLFLVLPLVTLISGPAGANNKMICKVQAAEPQQPLRNPVPIVRAGTLFCPNVVVNWRQGKCEKSDNPTNFCVLVDSGSHPPTRFIYRLMEQDGKPECEFVRSENGFPSASVMDCDPDSNYPQ